MVHTDSTAPRRSCSSTCNLVAPPPVLPCVPLLMSRYKSLEVCRGPWEAAWVPNAGSGWARGRVRRPAGPRAANGAPPGMPRRSSSLRCASAFPSPSQVRVRPKMSAAWRLVPQSAPAPAPACPLQAHDAPAPACTAAWVVYRPQDLQEVIRRVSGFALRTLVRRTCTARPLPKSLKPRPARCRKPTLCTHPRDRGHPGLRSSKRWVGGWVGAHPRT